MIGDMFLLSSRACGLSYAFLRSLISQKEISLGETHSNADGTFARELLSLSRSSRPFSAPLLTLFCCVAPSYIKQTVSLAALGDTALIIQQHRMGVMQCAALDTLHEDLSLLKWAKLGWESLSDAGINLWRSFLLPMLTEISWPPSYMTNGPNLWCLVCANRSILQKSGNQQAAC